MSNLTTICIPAYNQEAFIGECIRSALEQSHPNLDILVVDDCSTDRTLEIARSFRDRRLTVLRNDSNLGLAGNWNRVVHLARGDYVKLLCGDDVLYPYCVERQVLAPGTTPRGGHGLLRPGRYFLEGKKSAHQTPPAPTVM